MAENNFYKRSTIPPFPPDEGKSSEKPPFPSMIGPYRVETLLDKGGMSLLYLGTHPETQAPITIKVLSPKFLAHPEMTARFLKEAEIIAMADHPNIVKLYGYGEWEGGLYIAMEFIQGISLRQYLLQNPLSLKKALEMVLEIAYALCHLHTYGVIHRDLKPENILVNESGHIKVIDFGIAQLINPQEKAEKEISHARLVGTPVYMSPEQRILPESVSYPSDIYSLGIIAYELVLGKLSHGEVHLSLMPKGMQKILSKALQPNPSDRYHDIVDFISDLSTYLHSPHFEKEKKIGDQAAEIFEKFQSIQQWLLPSQTIELEGFETGFVAHRPLGLSSIFVEFIPEKKMLLMAESAVLEAEGLMQLLHLKGLLTALLPLPPPIALLGKKLNELLAKAPLNHPICFLAMHWDIQAGKAEFLSCGYGPIWRISHQTNAISMHPTPNVALGIAPEFNFTVETLPLLPGDSLIICPLSTAGTPFSEEQFYHLLQDLVVLPPQKQAESIYRKAKSLSIRYFDEHPFVVTALLVK